jgi:hypothetical protein
MGKEANEMTKTVLFKKWCFLTVLVILSALTLVGFNSSPGIGAVISVSGGADSTWSVTDSFVTTNGLPTGGICSFAIPGSAAIFDASIQGQGDAFDEAAAVWVENTQVGGVLSQTGNTISFGQVSIAGLGVQMRYDVLTTSATLRNLVTFNNPTGSDVSVTVEYASNFGSNGSTTVIGTSSGDTIFDYTDGWVVTDDSSTTGVDPANTTVLFGPDSPDVTASSVSQTVFDCSGTQGILVTYEITVPAGETRALLFYHQLNNTADSALTAAAIFNTTPAEGSDLIEGLSEQQLEQVLNWSFNRPPVALCRDVVASADEACQAADIDVDDGSFDPEGNPFMLAQDPPGPYQLGENQVMLTATDDSGRSNSCIAIVTVMDDTPPALSMSVEKDRLWAPFLGMRDVGLSYELLDNCDEKPLVTIEVTSDEPTTEIHAFGGPRLTPDAAFDDNGNLYLRAERYWRGDGRVYEVTVTATDTFGNSTTQSNQVQVRRKRWKNAVDSGQDYDAFKINWGSFNERHPR